VDFASYDALTGTKDQKHQEGGSDHADDDEDQSWAGEARSLLRWWNRRFHWRLDADRGVGGGFGKEVPHGSGYLFEVGFEGEVACVQKLHGGVGVIARRGFRAWRDEERVVLAPDREQRRLRFAEVLLEGRVEFYVVSVVEKEIQLNVHVAGALETNARTSMTKRRKSPFNLGGDGRHCTAMA
jgi:hypothetical protein